MSADSFDQFMDALEKMIDAQDDMWQEEKYHNHKQMWEIKAERYEPAREEARTAFREAIREEIRQMNRMDR
jgi:hypothetical protein